MITDKERLHGQQIFTGRWREESTNESNAHRQKHVAILSKVLSEITDGTFVEIGTGSGSASKIIATTHPNCRVIGIDSAEDALSLANHDTPQNVSFIKGDAFELPIESSTASASWTEGLIEHYPKSWRTIINEQFRITKPNGLVITSVPNILNLPRTFATIVQSRNFRYYPANGFMPGSLGALSKKYQELGISVEQMYGWGITYPAQNMYRWNSQDQKREYPLYTKIFHCLGNITARPIEIVDELFNGGISKWAGFEFMLVGRKYKK